MEEHEIQKLNDDFQDDLYDRREFEICIKKAKKAFELYKINKVENKHYYWICLISIARSYNELNQPEESLEYGLEALKYVRVRDKVIQNKWTIARSYIMLGEKEKSENYFTEVINYYIETENNMFLANAYNMKAWYFEDLEMAKESLKRFKMSTIEEQKKNNGLKKSILDTVKKLMSN